MKRVWTLPLVAALVLLSAPPAFGQVGQAPPPSQVDPPPQGPQVRPYLGLYGAGQASTTQSLTLSSSIGGGYDSHKAYGPGGAPVDPLLSGDSTVGHGSAGMAYSLNRSRVGINASASTGATYYPSRQRSLVQSYGGNVGGSWTIFSGLRLMANHSVTYQPLYFVPSLFPSLFDPALLQATQINTSLGSRATSRLMSASHVNLTMTRSLTRRIGVNFGYDYGRSRSPFDQRNLETQGVGGGVTVGIAKGLGFRLGYRQQVGKYASNATFSRPTGRTIDAGLDFNRSLSLWRKMRLSFRTGSAILKDDSQTHYRAIGSAFLSREIGRTWNATVGFSRDVGFLDTFQDPVFSDALRVSVSGLLGRRVQIRTSAGAAKGEVGFGTANQFDSRFATAGVGYALTRYLQAGVDYSYYRYLFDSGIVLPLGSAQRMDRQSLRVHLNLSLSLLNNSRRSNASR